MFGSSLGGRSALEVPLAHSKSALKRWRQNEAHHERNKPVRSEGRTAVKTARAAIGAGAVDEAKAAVSAATAILDRAAKRNVIHKNAASRSKSRLMKHLNAIGSAPAEEAPKKARKTAAKKPAAKKPAAKKPATKAKPAAKA
jgi:small subunit ribosomal protein S20